MSSRKGYLKKIPLLAAFYILSGKLGLFLAVPPGYATIIWPASGIAIGALLLHGWRLWPGIFIGSFLLNSFISDAFSFSGGFVPDKTWVAAAIAAGSTLQALAGYTMIRRFIGLPLHLDTLRHVLLLFLLSGPTACLIAASAGVSALHFSGILPVENMAGNWLTWWLGDMFGVFVFLPLMLVSPGNNGKLFWRGSPLGTLPLLAVLALLVPLGLTFYSWKIVSENHYQSVLRQFEALSTEAERALVHRLDTYDYALLGGAGFI